MMWKLYFKKLLVFIVRMSIEVDLRLFKRKKLSSSSTVFKVYYLGYLFILGFAAYKIINHYWNSTTVVIWVIIVYLILSIFILGLFMAILKNRRVDISDHYIQKPSVLKRREQPYNNLGFTFTDEQLHKIYSRFFETEFINENTSFESFEAVFTEDFGHNHKVQWNITLGQLNEIFKIFKRLSNHFKPDLVFRKELFLSNKGTLIKIESFNNAKKSRSARNNDINFQDNLSHINDLIKHIIKEND